MNYVDINDINTKNKKFIGAGTTAKCYKLNDGSVLKLFKNNYDAYLVLNKDLFSKDMNKFTKISNNTFKGPNKLVMDNNKLVGYIYPYVNGKTINKLNKNTKIRNIFRNYYQIINDVKDITDKSFYLFDSNYENIIYDNYSIHIIDLDKCWFYENGNKNTLLSYNSKDVFTNIVGGFFNKKYFEDIEFKDNILNNQYNDTDCTNIDSINDFIDCLSYYCRDNNPDIKTVKNKIKVKHDLNGYYHM